MRLGDTVVYYYSSSELANQGGFTTNGQRSAPAIIVTAWGDGEAALNLRVLTDSADGPLWRTSVPNYDARYVSEDGKEFGCYWRPLGAELPSRASLEAENAEKSAPAATA